MSEFDIILDSSQQNLKEVPLKILDMTNLRMLYLQQNFIKVLPANFFQKLPQLEWLDLRNNHLTTLPASIAHHQHLENLLLSDNKIEAIPIEVGSLPKLKVLQVANNPLVYPNTKIISEGTKSILAYLKHQYEKLGNPIVKESENRDRDGDDHKEMKEEKEIRVMADYVNDNFTTRESINSSLVVKGLSEVKMHDSGIVHKMSASNNKILLKSYYDEENYSKASTQTGESITYLPSYKQSWMAKLKELLDQQEKILQQERNLQALTSWRAEKKAEPMRQQLDYQTPPPYAVDERYNSMLSREDMHKEIDKLMQNRKSPPKIEDVEKLISDLVSQLKDMEATYGGLQSPRTEIEAAGSQITKIMDMHKKILKLRETNDLLLQ